MKTIEINLYSFSELSKEAQQKAINKWYETEDYPFLSDDLTESCKNWLSAANVEYLDIKLYYSLSSSQGDGLCFTGIIEKDGNKLVLKHSARYYYATSVNMKFYDKDGEEVEDNEELKAIYLDTCRKLEKEGYDTIYYRMTFEEFADHCEANEYTFEAIGKMNNG